MSSSAGSSCMCFPKALSAFATLVSLPTGAAPLSCRFAFNYSEPYSLADRTRSLPCPGTEPALALSQMWRPHGGHRETYCCPAPTPFSALSGRSRSMKLRFQARSLGAPHLLPPGCALLAPKPPAHFQTRLKVLPQPHPNYNQTNPACALLTSSSSSRSLFHSPNTIEFA
jgi:hypothetical protein